MWKLILLPLLLVSGCLIAGIYGVLHNQISFSVSPEYFFDFKFHQFAIPEHLRTRVGASLVGWHASWWMGVVIGMPLLIVGLIMPDARSYLIHGLIAFAIVALTAFLVGLGALAYGSFTISEGSLPGFWYPDGVTDKVAFARAGNMHNFSYLGGGIGILTGSTYLILARLRMTQRLES